MADREKCRAIGAHLTLKALKQELWRQNIVNDYITKENIPTYPRPELYVKHISHSTDLDGLEGIKENGGFRNPYISQEPKMVWFSLTPSLNELQEAEDRDVTLVHPGRRPQIISGEDLPEDGKLQDFATSPAFSSCSRYGSFRFTYSLGIVLNRYRWQFCGGEDPVFRVYRTVLYRQEVMYAVLVHRPSDNLRFSQFPLLKQSRICGFTDWDEPHFFWRPQAMSGTHSLGLVQDYYGNFSTRQYYYEHYYLWDHVALALHVGDKVLKFGDDLLRYRLRFCEGDSVTVPRQDQYVSYQTYDEADDIVSQMWPDHPPLKRFDKCQFHIND